MTLIGSQELSLLQAAKKKSVERLRIAKTDFESGKVNGIGFIV